MRYQPIYDIAEIAAQHGVRHAVLCPGSRCAPLTLAFSRHPRIKTYTFSDERSAGFIALGMAQALAEPVIVVCTSGTAASNLSPAMAEAFFSKTPLLVITADRPAEWIGQLDGQTIFQHNLFGQHAKRFFLLPQDYEHPDSLWAINRMVNEALLAASDAPRGPVHINAPFREPLYPAGDAEIVYTEQRIIHSVTGESRLTPEALEALTRWQDFSSTLIVGGQQPLDPQLLEVLRELQAKHHLPVVHDILSNLHGLEESVRYSDLFLGQSSTQLKERLRPELLITFGDALVSKNLKLFLRKFPAKEHWHIQPAGEVADTYCQLTHVFRVEPKEFFKSLAKAEAKEAFEKQKQENYYRLWEVEERRTRRVVHETTDGELHELLITRRLLSELPAGSCLHLANSMSVRYANMAGLDPAQADVKVFSNRGTSGIDGSTSTAVGHALVNDGPHFLITGDLAFFYDRNAFWHNYALPNLHILLLNNHGGLIFDVLEGPSSMPEAGEYFITRQGLSSRKLCEEFGFDYLALDRIRKLENLLRDFLAFDGQTKILELEGDTSTNKAAIENLKQKIKSSYEK
jgi:2-succinyl-5-enolpyruvyl-6-hydroxy-3-cyclohexene-1-carboxylate synthase